ncbi:hypothetical protein MPL3356_10030 [Mesorhizobium plurifarium]|uniref:Uncharacterized protein n=1 Tax=Mesorhizobium plurifarium TaxID=69974 RepID=A0A090EWC6_MESPL|nr:hypothetical protein MPL3356_10030 [Mesorhizobium plurifarium]
MRRGMEDIVSRESASTYIMYKSDYDGNLRVKTLRSDDGLSSARFGESRDTWKVRKGHGVR